MKTNKKKQIRIYWKCEQCGKTKNLNCLLPEGTKLNSCLICGSTKIKQEENNNA